MEIKILRRLPLDHSVLELPRLTRHRPLNPSFIVKDDKLRIIYRGCNYHLRKRGYQKFYGSAPSPVSDTQNYIAWATLDLELKGVGFIEDRHIRARKEALDGIQDLKLFEWRNSLFAIGSGCNTSSFLEKTTPTRMSTMMLFNVDESNLRLVSIMPTGTLEEKNWMPWVKDDDLYFVQWPNPFQLLKFEVESKSVQECRRTSYSCFEAPSSGSGAIVPLDDRFVGMIHKRRGKGVNSRYFHRLIILTNDMRISRVSERFSFEGENIEYGSSVAIHGANIYLGYGVYDERAMILRTDRRRLFESLNWQDCGDTG